MYNFRYFLMNFRRFPSPSSHRVYFTFGRGRRCLPFAGPPRRGRSSGSVPQRKRLTTVVSDLLIASSSSASQIKFARFGRHWERKETIATRGDRGHVAPNSENRANGDDRCARVSHRLIVRFCGRCDADAERLQPIASPSPAFQSFPISGIG